MFLTWKTTTLLDITDIHTNGLQSGHVPIFKHFNQVNHF